MNSTSSTFFIILSAVIVAAGAYWFYFVASAADEPLTAAPTINESQVHFQTLVSQLQPIDFNTKILTDPRFTGLKDLTTPIAQEPKGRLDPFAPVAGVSAL